jgi:hypothetical protein
MEAQKQEPVEEVDSQAGQEEKTNADAPQKSPEQGEPTKAQASTPTEAKKGSNVGLIIVIIVLAVAILGVGGYFGGKFLYNKYVKKTTSATATPTTGKTSVKSVIDALMYPGSTIADQKQDSESAYKAELTLSSADSVNTIKAYYLKLITDKKWKITQQGSSGDDNFYTTITDGVFTAEIDITKYTGYDTTDIRILISGDSLVSDGLAVSPTSATKTSTSSSAKTSSDYVISDTNARVISESELVGMTPWQLKVARNEIYARHGREFVHQDLKCYFESKTWYGVDPLYSESALSTTENKNVATILAYEEKTNSPLLQTDSGCNAN